MSSPFQALARSIVYQQLSGKAAATIHGRFAALMPQGSVTAEAVLALEDDVLRGAGLSRNKAAAIRDLAHKTLDGTVPGTRRLRTMDDAEIIERLTCVRGVGRWTVEMLLIFTLGRPDVLPVTDLGVRKGFMQTYRKRKLPTSEQLARAGRRWAPYRSVAAWYFWRSLDIAVPE
jgi:DNA-3-methyladenine glycosylase II